MEYQYRFTVIMACHNSAGYLGKTVSSLVKQSIAFNNIQLIAVNCGSTDKTVSLLKKLTSKYPDSITLISKRKATINAGRNLALQQVRGKYVTFLSPGDGLAEDCLEKVFSFLETHQDRLAAACVPVFYHGQQKGPHPANRRFTGGEETIDLNKRWDALEPLVSSYFFRAEALESVRFDENLSLNQDPVDLLEVFGKYPRLGLVGDTRYKCLVREDACSSLGNPEDENDPQWYAPVLRKSWLLRLKDSRDSLGTIPKYIQYAIVSQLSSRIRLAKIPEGVLDEQEIRLFTELSRQIISLTDSDVIASLQTADHHVRLAMLKDRQGTVEVRTGPDGNAVINFDDLSVCPLSGDIELRIDFMTVKDDTCRLEGRCYSALDILPQITAIVDGHSHDAIIGKLADMGCLIDAHSTKAYSYDVSFPIHDRSLCSLTVSFSGFQLQPQNTVYGKFLPLRKKYPDMYSQQGKYLIRRQDSEICFRRNSFFRHLLYELRFQKNIISSKYTEETNLRRCAFKACVMRPAALLARKLPLKETWLLRDRNSVADDNGLVMYEYLRDNHPEINAVFAIMDSTEQFRQLSAKGRVVDPFSRRYRWLFLRSRYVISSAADEDIINPFKETYEFYMDLVPYCHYIFLQHGVTKDDLSGWLKRYGKNLTAIITSAKREQESFRAPSYGYPPESIWLTGMPRFDRLTDERKKIITLALTWRRSLVGKRDKIGHYEATEQLKNSDYIQRIQSLLTNSTLLDNAEKNGYTIQLVPHPNMLNHIHLIKPDPRVRVAIGISYNQIFRESDLLISDYSSVAFDFAYLYKPVIYYQFDHDEFFSHHTYTEGYFSYLNDGFGEIVQNEDELVSLISEYMAADCQMKPKYAQRVTDFFAFHDRNCCERVYEKLIRCDTAHN